MNSYIYEVIVYLVEAIISGVFLINLLRAKHNIILQLLLWCEIVLAVMLVTPPFSAIRILIVGLAELVFTMVVFEDSVARKIKVFFLKELVLLSSSACAYAIYSLLIENHTPYLYACESDNCTYCLLYLLLFSVITSIVFQFAKERKGVEFAWIVGTQIIVGIGEGISVLSVAKSSADAIDAQKSGFIVIAMIFMVAANISIGLLAPYLLKQEFMAKNIDYGTELSNMEYKYYEMSVENDKKIMQLKHDISNHIQTISSLLDSGDNKRGIEFLDELKNQYANVEQMVYCNNPVINIILVNKKREAEENGIDVSINVKEGLENIPITDFDLSTIICNLLDNAIRGCICSEQTLPKMVVEILKKNQYLVIRILNSCKVSMNIENTDRIETTKSNTQTHGFGMPIVANIAKKYRGDFIVSANNGIFTATAILSVKGCKR